jgi:hypothetical protein
VESERVTKLLLSQNIKQLAAKHFYASVWFWIDFKVDLLRLCSFLIVPGAVPVASWQFHNEFGT